MKFTKLSLIAAIAVTTAMAGDAKISGDAKLFYSTTDASTNDFFDKPGSIGDTALELKYSRDLAEGITVNAGITGVSTLGLEGSLVNGTWVKHANDANVSAVGGVQDKLWLDTANIVAKVANTTLVVGRQMLDTPFFYSETWNIVPNTFDAAVAVNNDIPDTTLVAAWVGRGNGATGGATVTAANNGAGFSKFGANKNAYAAAIVNKSIPNTALQAWYYSITSTAKAYWLQADTTVAKNITLGAQYAGASLTQGAANRTHAYAVKAGYSMGAAKAHIAYSKRNNQAGGIDISNIPTGAGIGGRASESKLYTEAFWNYGFVGSQDAATVSVGGSYDLGAAQVGLSHTSVNTGSLVGNDMKETAVTASTKVGPVDATVAYINTHAQAVPGHDIDTVQAYLTVPFSL
jgi:hypothetical protein